MLIYCVHISKITQKITLLQILFPYIATTQKSIASQLLSDIKSVLEYLLSVNQNPVQYSFVTLWKAIQYNVNMLYMQTTHFQIPASLNWI